MVPRNENSSFGIDQLRLPFELIQVLMSSLCNSNNLHSGQRLDLPRTGLRLAGSCAYLQYLL